MKINQELYRSIYLEEHFKKDGKEYARGMIIARPATGEDFSRACQALSGDDEKVVKTLTDFGGVLIKEAESRIAPSDKVTWREEWLETRQSLEYGRGLCDGSDEVRNRFCNDNARNQRNCRTLCKGQSRLGQSHGKARVSI